MTASTFNSNATKQVSKVSNLSFQRQLGENICFQMFYEFKFQSLTRVNDFRDYYEVLAESKVQYGEREHLKAEELARKEGPSSMSVA